MARPKGVKIGQLTPDNVAALTACRDQYGVLPKQLVITATTATWPLTFNAAGALQTVLDAIAQTQGTTRRALHAPRRKLEKLVRPGTSPVVPTPDPPKARKTKNPVACQAAGHGELVGVGTGRAKCLDCGLIVDRPTPKPTRQRAARTRRTAAALDTLAQARPDPQAAYAAIRADLDGPWLVVDLSAAIVIATCPHGEPADRIVAALNQNPERTPR